MQVIQNINSTSFTLNGLKYVKNFIVIKQGNSNVAIHNYFDTTFQLMPSTPYNQVQVNGLIYPNQGALMSVLAPILFAKSGGSGGDEFDESKILWSGSTGTVSIVPKYTTNVASGNYSVAVGDATLASGHASFAEGQFSTASGYASHSEGYDTKAIGEGSHAEGSTTQAIGDTAHAEGNLSIASGVSSHAEGRITKAIGNYSHSEGRETIANAIGSHVEGLSGSSSVAAIYSHVEGIGSKTFGTYSHAEGFYTIASGNNSHSEGAATQANGAQSHAEGQSTQAIGLQAHAEGFFTTASGNNSHAEGNSTEAIGAGSHAEGGLTVAIGDYSHAEGYSSEANGRYGHAEGFDTSAFGVYSHSQGKNTTANGYGSHAGGVESVAWGDASFVHGSGSTANNDHVIVLGRGITGSTANTTYVDNLNIKTVGTGVAVNNLGIDASGKVIIGTVGSGGTGSSYWSASTGSNSFVTVNSNSLASGDYSIALGLRTKATGYTSHAEGFETVAGGNDSHAEGSTTKALGNNSHAEGGATIATGSEAHSEGVNTLASGNQSHAEGYGTSATTQSAHAEGHYTLAGGAYSHAQGYGSKTSGLYSHAGGLNTIAVGLGSFVHGLNSTAQADYTIVLGRNMTGTSIDTTYVDSLNIKTVRSGTSLINLGIDSNGNVVSGTTGSGGTSSVSLWSAGTGVSSVIQTGSTSIASGDLSLAANYANKAIGFASAAFGSVTSALTSNSFAVGSQSLASGDTSFASGSFTKAMGGNSAVFGQLSEANGYASMATGVNAKTNANNSFAQGTSVVANGQNSVVFGSASTASAIGTIVLGRGITGNTADTTYVDKFNIKNLGLGTPISNIGVDASGNVVVASGSTSTSSIPYLGSITPTSVSSGSIGAALWSATQAGTYTNFGEVVVSGNSFATISRDNSGIFSISQTPIDLGASNYIATTDLSLIAGKNKFDNVGQIEINRGINNAGVIGTNDGWVGAKIPVSAGTQYSFSHSDGAYGATAVGQLAYLNSSSATISTVDMSTLPAAGGLGGKTLTTPAGTAFIYKNVKVLTRDYLNIFQLELGTSTTTYEAYSPFITKIKTSPIIDTDTRNLAIGNSNNIATLTAELAETNQKFNKTTNWVCAVKANGSSLSQIGYTFDLDGIPFVSGDSYHLSYTIKSNDTNISSAVKMRTFQNTQVPGNSTGGAQTPQETIGTFAVPSSNISFTKNLVSNLRYLHIYLELTLPTANQTTNFRYDNITVTLNGVTLSPLNYAIYAPVAGDSVTYNPSLSTDTARISDIPSTALFTANGLANKVMAIIGDSMVKGHNLPANQVWDSLIASRNAMTSVNYGINGTQLTNDNSFGGSVLSRYSGMTNDADYIGVFAGTNDDVANVPIGNDSDSYSGGQLTFKGALNNLCTGLIDKYPNKKIYFITPYNRRTNTQAYITAIITICKKYSIPVFDNWTNGGVSWSNTTQTGLITLGDTYHLNTAGMQYASAKYEAFLRSL